MVNRIAMSNAESLHDKLASQDSVPTVVAGEFLCKLKNRPMEMSRVCHTQKKYQPRVPNWKKLFAVYHEIESHFHHNIICIYVSCLS